MSVEDDVNAYATDLRRINDQSHERAMRRTKVKVAKIESRPYQETHTYRVLIAACAAVAISIIGGCTYLEANPRTLTPAEAEQKQQQYELCMSEEHNDEVCG